MQNNPCSRERMIGLDALRGFAALSILVYHCNALLKLQEWPSWTGYLSLAVPLFFSLSAFSLSIRYYGELDNKNRILYFYTRRFLRIAPLFYVMLLVYSLRRLYYGWGLPRADDIILTLTFLFPFVPGRHESLVAAGWSLGLEMVFYGLFPLLVAYATNLRRTVFVMLLALALQAASGYTLSALMPRSNFYWLALTTQLAFFVSGILVFHIYTYSSHLPSYGRLCLSYITFICCLAFLICGVDAGLFEIRVDGWPALRPLIGFVLAALILSFALTPLYVLCNPITVFLGEISYGLYLIHPFMIIVLGKPLQQALLNAGLEPAAVTWLVIGGILLATLCAATVSFYLLERPFTRLRWRPATQPSVGTP